MKWTVRPSRCAPFSLVRRGMGYNIWIDNQSVTQGGRVETRATADQVPSAKKHHPWRESRALSSSQNKSDITCVQSCVPPAEYILFLAIHMQNNWLVLCVTCEYSVIHLCAEARECVSVEHSTLFK
jgi:hypothetical protein